MEASVEIEKKIKSNIANGMLVFLGIEDKDTEDDIEWLANKISNLRIFDDENGIMNKSIKETNGEVLVVSQFTLMASTKKGNRPSYIKASKPEFAVPMYQKFCEKLEIILDTKISTGEFGADMKICLINNGPVTLCIDTKNKE